MKLLAYFRSVTAKLFRRSQVDDDMEQELRSHIQHRADTLVGYVQDRDEAFRRAG